MTIKVSNLEGNELADGYTRKSVPKGRWADTWDVFKSNFLKFILLNLAVCVTFIPGVAVMFVRSNVYIASLGISGPFNPSLPYPFNPSTVGLSESITLSADLMAYALLFVAAFIASIGVSGAAYCVKKIINTHGECKVRDFFHGIKVCYFATVLPVTIFMAFMFSTAVVGDWMRLVIFTGGNKAGAITAYVFVIIATVLVGLFCGWLFAVGTGYKVKLVDVFKNAANRHSVANCLYGGIYAYTRMAVYNWRNSAHNRLYAVCVYRIFVYTALLDGVYAVGFRLVRNPQFKACRNR